MDVVKWDRVFPRAHLAAVSHFLSCLADFLKHTIELIFRTTSIQTPRGDFFPVSPAFL
jgi:hypothetical protein